MPKVPALLLLAVALFAGFVPLRRCHATEGGSGVVPLGQHVHGHDAVDQGPGSARQACVHGLDDTQLAPLELARAQEACTHDGCGGPLGEPAPIPEERCCVDTPFDAGLASASVSLALPALAPTVHVTCPGDLTRAPAPELASSRDDAPPDALRNVRTTVLLR